MPKNNLFLRYEKNHLCYINKAVVAVIGLLIVDTEVAQNTKDTGNSLLTVALKSEIYFFSPKKSKLQLSLSKIQDYFGSGLNEFITYF